MNKRTLQLLLDMLIAILLSVALGWLSRLIFNPDVFQLALWPIPLIWIGLRHGGATAVVSSAIAGLALSLILPAQTDNQWINFLSIILPMLATGVTGLFARNTQKTLNNRRYSSTYLNIWTASLLVIAIAFLLKAGLNIFLLDIPWQQALAMSNWTDVLLSILLSGIVFTLIARFMPHWLIPKRSKYLSRMETSSLLND